MDTEFWTQFLNQLLLKFAPAVFVFLAGWVVKVAGNLWTEFKIAKPTLANNLCYAANMAVAAAEKAGLKSYALDKKDYAIQVATKYLNNIGLKNVDVSLISAAIEEAGMSSGLFNWAKKEIAPVINIEDVIKEEKPEE